MLIKLLVGEAVLMVLSVYAPQTGLEESTKDVFYDSLQTVISELPDKEIVIPCGDWNGHVGREAAGYEGVHGGSGYGERKIDFILLRKRNLKMAKRHQGNTKRGMCPTSQTSDV